MKPPGTHILIRAHHATEIGRHIAGAGSLPLAAAPNEHFMADLEVDHGRQMVRCCVRVSELLGTSVRATARFGVTKT